MEEDLEKNRLGAKSDIEFHLIIASATHNWAYVHMLQTIYDLLQEELRIAWGEVFGEKKNEKYCSNNIKVFLSAIRDRNPEKGSR